MIERNWKQATIWAALVCLLLGGGTFSAHAEIDGHGPDAWRVTGVAANDVLNARMGPGTNYPVIEKFPHNERGLQQITCVPYYTPAHYGAMTRAQIDALPQRWCLMRNRSLSKAGWVAQRFITPDQGGDARAATTQPAREQPARSQPAKAPVKVTSSSTKQGQRAAQGDKMIEDATRLVRKLYDASERAEQGKGADPAFSAAARQYFTADIVAMLRSGQLDAHPLYGAQDYDGHVVSIAPDPEQPMLRGMITINVDFLNFGQQQQAVFYLRPDDTQKGAPLLIFRVDHDGWSYP